MNNYAKTIEKVKKVNRQAALIMARKLPLLKQRGRMEGSVGPSLKQPAPELESAFYWDSTPQGHEYWAKIATEIQG